MHSMDDVLGHGGPKKILAVASGGGHWVQLLRMLPAFRGHHLVYVTTLDGYRSEVAPAPFYVVNDANRWNKLRLLRVALRFAVIIACERPDVIISTGAAPGYFAVRIGKLAGAKTIWVDSVANVDELSLSGQRVGAHADLWLTQWPHLAREGGPAHRGSVL